MLTTFCLPNLRIFHHLVTVSSFLVILTVLTENSIAQQNNNNNNYKPNFNSNNNNNNFNQNSKYGVNTNNNNNNNFNNNLQQQSLNQNQGGSYSFPLLNNNQNQNSQNFSQNSNQKYSQLSQQQAQQGYQNQNNNNYNQNQQLTEFNPSSQSTGQGYQSQSNQNVGTASTFNPSQYRSNGPKQPHQSNQNSKIQNRVQNQKLSQTPQSNQGYQNYNQNNNQNVPYIPSPSSTAPAHSDTEHFNPAHPLPKPQRQQQQPFQNYYQNNNNNNNNNFAPNVNINGKQSYQRQIQAQGYPIQTNQVPISTYTPPTESLTENFSALRLERRQKFQFENNILSRLERIENEIQIKNQSLSPNNGNSFEGRALSGGYGGGNVNNNFNNNVNNNGNGKGNENSNQQIAPPPITQDNISGVSGGYSDYQPPSSSGAGSLDDAFGGYPVPAPAGVQNINYTTSRPSTSGGYSYEPAPTQARPSGSVIGGGGGGYGPSFYPDSNPGQGSNGGGPIQTSTSTTTPRPIQVRPTPGGSFTPSQSTSPEFGGGNSPSVPSQVGGAGFPGGRPSQGQTPTKPTNQGQDAGVFRPMPTQGGGNTEQSFKPSQSGQGGYGNGNVNANENSDASGIGNNNRPGNSNGFNGLPGGSQPTRPSRPNPDFEINVPGESDGTFSDNLPSKVTPSKDFINPTLPSAISQQIYKEMWDIRDSIPGQPAADYPVLHKVPKTSFNCEGRITGFYADPETRCQVFHRCTDCEGHTHIIRESFLCPNGTQFNQQILTCDWWANVDCQSSENFFSINEKIGAKDQEGKYVELAAQRIPILPKKETPRIIPFEERSPLPPELQSTHHSSNPHGSHHEGQQSSHNQNISSSVQNQNVNPTKQPLISSGSSLVPNSISRPQSPSIRNSGQPSPVNSPNLQGPIPVSAQPNNKATSFLSQDYSDYFTDDDRKRNNPDTVSITTQSPSPNSAQFRRNKPNNNNNNNNNSRYTTIITNNEGNTGYKSEKITFFNPPVDDIDYHARILSKIISEDLETNNNNNSNNNRVRKRVSYSVNRNQSPSSEPKPQQQQQSQSNTKRPVRNRNENENASPRLKPVDNKPFKITGVSYTYRIVAD